MTSTFEIQIDGETEGAWTFSNKHEATKALLAIRDYIISHIEVDCSEPTPFKWNEHGR